MSGGTWQPLWPLIEPILIDAQPKRKLPRPNSEGWIGALHSPLRNDAHPSLSVLPDSPTDPGCYKDHATGETGPISKLAEQLNIDPRQSKPPAQQKQPSALTFDEFCAQRKLDPGHLSNRWGVKDATWNGRRALRFTTRLGIDRIKYLDGAKPKYGWTRAGGTAHWYGLQEAIAIGGPLYLVNGEPSVWACQQEGVGAICVSAGEGTLPTPQMIAELIAAQINTLTVIYDRDQEGNEGAAKVVEALKTAGIDATACELPAYLGEHGDVDDFHRWHGADLGKELAALPTLMPPSPQPSSTRRWLTEAEHDQLPPGAYLLDQEIPADGITVLYGPSGSGKTFVALDYGMKIAQTRPVMFVPAEDSAGLALRRRAWRAFHQNTTGTVYTWPEEVNLMNPAGEVDTFIDQTRGLDLGIIIFDTLHQSMVGGDENSSRDMGMVIQSCKRIQRETGAAIMLVHHTGKNGASERGSSALRGAAHTMIELSNEDGTIRLRCDKAKNSAPFADRFLRLFETASSCVALPAESVMTTKAAPLTKAQRDVLELLSLDIFENVGARSNEIARSTRIPEGSLWRTLSTLKRLRYVEQSVKGDPYYITSEGKAKLEEGTIAGLSPYSAAQPSQPSPTINLPSDGTSPTLTTNHQSPSHPLGVMVDGGSDGEREGHDGAKGDDGLEQEIDRCLAKGDVPGARSFLKDIQEMAALQRCIDKIDQKAKATHE